MLSVSAPEQDFDERLRRWKRADGHLAEARERLSRAVLDGAEAEHAEELHRDVLRCRAQADTLLTDLLQDIKRRSAAGAR